MIPGYRDFEFDLPDALLNHLVRVLNGFEPASLDLASLARIPDAQGVYQLFLNDDLVYIGKTDAEAGLGRRLRRHHEKIQHRRNLDSAQVFFKAVRVYVFTAVDLETQLINYYNRIGNVKWNGSGFGSNDPGRQRDTTEYKDEHFDFIYPIDIDRTIDAGIPLVGSAADILITLKNILPYTFRFETAGKSRKPHYDLINARVELPLYTNLTARQIISLVVAKLPSGWQAVHFPSHIILYKNNRDYIYGKRIAQS